MDMGTRVMHTLPTSSCRQKILKEKAVPMIEGYMFEEHEMIRRAATECMCNLAMSKEVRLVWPVAMTEMLAALHFE